MVNNTANLTRVICTSDQSRSLRFVVHRPQPRLREVRVSAPQRSTTATSFPRDVGLSRKSHQYVGRATRNVYCFHAQPSAAESTVVLEEMQMPPAASPVSIVNTGSAHDDPERPQPGIALCLSGGGYRA